MNSAGSGSACGRVIDVYTLFPHAGGRKQSVAYGFWPKAQDYPYASVMVSDAEKDAAGVSYAKIVYNQSLSGMWTFAKKK